MRPSSAVTAAATHAHASWLGRCAQTSAPTAPQMAPHTASWRRRPSLSSSMAVPSSPWRRAASCTVAFCCTSVARASRPAISTVWLSEESVRASCGNMSVAVCI
eukprot:jgi/Chrpa1/8001/Chrysochromulina_OHIO_Genome00003280-RA